LFADCDCGSLDAAGDGGADGTGYGAVDATGWDRWKHLSHLQYPQAEACATIQPNLWVDYEARCSAGFFTRLRFKAVLIRATCEKACGKLPTRRSCRGSYSSDRRPTSLR